MRRLARHLLLILTMSTFVGVSTGVALAVHLNLHHAESGCCHDSHDHGRSGQDHPDKDEHDSSHCITCQQLGMVTKRILTESPSSIPELTVIEFDHIYATGEYADSYSFPPRQPRAPPA